MTEEQGAQILSELQTLSGHQAGAKAALEVSNALLGACFALLLLLCVIQVAKVIRR